MMPIAAPIPAPDNPLSPGVVPQADKTAATKNKGAIFNAIFMVITSLLFK